MKLNNVYLLFPYKKPSRRFDFGQPDSKNIIRVVCYYVRYILCYICYIKLVIENFSCAQMAIILYILCILTQECHTVIQNARLINTHSLLMNELFF